MSRSSTVGPVGAQDGVEPTLSTFILYDQDGNPIHHAVLLIQDPQRPGIKRVIAAASVHGTPKLKIPQIN